jgi:hypothetical protein
MRTKSEVISFLESKVGGGVECKGNPSLNSQCVTLIKSLMEYLGVADPYKSRGHAKTAISAYLAEGIAKPGLGFISVFSNKNMGGGFGHIWCNAGEGNGTFYESNGAKSLIVTKGKTYTYDNVCNFDSYIKEDTTSDTQCQIDLVEANKHKENLQKQVDGLLVDIKAWEAKYNECNSQRIEAGSSSDGFRSQLNTLVAQLATKLGTRQEVPEILASVDTLITYEDKATELERRLAKEEADHASAISTLESKIKTLEANLESLKADLKAVKDTQITPSNLPTEWSIVSIIKRILGVK